MSTPIYPQFIHSNQLNAPQMGGAAGAKGQMLSVLDAVLVTGCCPNTAAEVTFEDTFIKITFGVNHGYEVLQFITISGASSPLFNGKHRIVKVTTGAVYILKGAIIDITGTISTVLSPLGWESMFGSTSTTKRAYRSKDLLSSRRVLYLNAETGGLGVHATRPAQLVRVQVCEDMKELGVQINSYTDEYDAPYPAGARYFIQAMHTTLANDSGGQNSPWVIVGDGKLFYFFVKNNAYSPSPSRTLYMFGDTPKLSSSDTFNTIISASDIDPFASLRTTYYNSMVASLGGALNFSTYYTGLAFVKDLSGGYNRDTCSLFAGLTSSVSGRGLFSPQNPLNYGYLFSDIAIRRSNFGMPVYAGLLPYLKSIGTDLATFNASLDLKQHSSHLLVLVVPDTSSSVSYAYYGIDLLQERVEDNNL